MFYFWTALLPCGGFSRLPSHGHVGEQPPLSAEDRRGGCSRRESRALGRPLPVRALGPPRRVLHSAFCSPPPSPELRWLYVHHRGNISLQAHAEALKLCRAHILLKYYLNKHPLGLRGPRRTEEMCRLPKESHRNVLEGTGQRSPGRRLTSRTKANTREPRVAAMPPF